MIRAKLTQRGASIPEAVIVLPVLLLLLMGFIQYGFVYTAYITLRNAAASSARFAYIQRTIDPLVVKPVADEAVTPGLDPARMSVSVENAAVGASTDAKRVRLLYQMPVFFGAVLPGASANTLELRAEAVSG